MCRQTCLSPSPEFSVSYFDILNIELKDIHIIIIHIILFVNGRAAIDTAASSASHTRRLCADNGAIARPTVKSAV